jgi:hypothetical protein
MAKTIVIEFDENGDCSIEGQGFVGPACDKALAEIEKALGQAIRRTKKPEYMQRPGAANRRTSKTTKG